MGPELARILALPVREQGDAPALPPALAHWAAHLWPIQHEALALLAQAPAPEGLYGDIPVGGGKFLIATLAGVVVGAKRPVVLTKPDLVKQAEREFAKFRRTFPELDAAPPRYVSYSTLSQTDSSDLLFELGPDFIALDEAHSVARASSARTKRLIKYLVQNPAVRVVVLSGTLHTKELRDRADLAEVALRQRTWLPLDPDVLRDWGEVLDHKAVPDPRVARDLFAPLVAWASANGSHGTFLEGEAEARQRAYRRRYLTCPGVVAPPPQDLGVQLVMRRWAPEPPPAVAAALQALQDDWTLPDGTALVDALEFWRAAEQLSLGFYYRGVWTGALGGAEEDAWREARRNWSRAIRSQIEYGALPGVDSAANVERAVLDRRAREDVQRAYWAWAEVRDTGGLERETVWLDKGVVQGAVERLLSVPRGLLWYDSATALEPVLAEALPVFGAGSDAPPDDVPHAALSRKVHGTGKNLQAWDRHVILAFPAGALAGEQLLGRSHRPGQQSARVVVDILQGTWAQKARLAGALAEAADVAAKSNLEMKILRAKWERA